MNKIKLLKELSIISPNWASKIRKFYVKKNMDEVSKAQCQTKDGRTIWLSDYRACIVGEAFLFPQHFFRHEQAEILYASCERCKYYSENIYSNIHNGHEVSFWKLINNFVIHFKATHLGRYETKLMIVYIDKLEQKIKETEKLIEVIQ